ncbi:MAG: helix-turn-helix domain-containing protein [Firmicutes bacterium]|nr:helix-turn-helix domain-containing protein [Bacillota bacterium]
MRVIDKIIILMSKEGINKSKLAKDLGISTGHFADWESGRSKPTADRITIIAKYFKVSTDYLLGLTDNPAPHYE